MTQHPYVGLAGTCSGRSGVVAAVGPVTRDGDSFIALYLLIDRGLTCEYDVTDFTPDNPAEARRRLTESTREWSGPDRWQYWTSKTNTHPDDRGEPEPGGFMAIGAWQPFASGDSWTDWRRPLRRVPE